MRDYPTIDQTLALAGILQAGALAHQLATQSTYHEASLLASARSILAVKCHRVMDLFDPDSFVVGLRLVQIALDADEPPIPPVMKGYCFAMHRHAGRLLGHAQSSQMIRIGLEAIRDEYLTSDDDHPVEDRDGEEHLYLALAELYSRTISPIKPKIKVRGHKKRLTNPCIANRIRTALFAGIRASALWRQLGGKRWHLIRYALAYRCVAHDLAHDVTMLTRQRADDLIASL